MYIGGNGQIFKGGYFGCPETWCPQGKFRRRATVSPGLGHRLPSAHRHAARTGNAPDPNVVPRTRRTRGANYADLLRQPS
jgi:hypothetical protein